MAADHRNSDDLGRFRGDGVDSWAPQHLTAAELRAHGRSWSDVSDEVGYETSTVRDYQTIPGFSDLVDHFREKLRSERLKEHWHEGVGEALDAQRSAIEGLKLREQRLRSKIENGTANEDETEAYEQVVKQLAHVSDSYLINLGFRKGEKTRRKLEAQEEITGEPGERVNVQTDRDQFDDLEDLEGDELKEEIEALEEIVDES